MQTNRILIIILFATLVIILIGLGKKISLSPKAEIQTDIATGFEAESGMVSGDAVKENDTLASSDSLIKFGTGTTTTLSPVISLTPTGIMNSSCLDKPGPVIALSGDQQIRYDTRSNKFAAWTKINAAASSWTALWPVQDSFNYPVLLAGAGGGCFYGGEIKGSYPELICDSPKTTGGSNCSLNDPDINNMTWEYTHSTKAIVVLTSEFTIENTRINNYGDGIGIQPGADNFVLKNVILSNIRDDCVENDWLYSGTIESVLFDGCYSAFSARTYSDQTPSPINGSNNTLVIRNSLIRLQTVKGVYKNRGTIPGHDGFFKWDNSGISPRLSLHNNIFRADQNSNNVGLGIPDGKLAECSNNIMVWLGQGAYPATLPASFNGNTCFTIVTDKATWDNAVSQMKVNVRL